MKKWMYFLLSAALFISMTAGIRSGNFGGNTVYAESSVVTDKNFDILETREGRYSDWYCYKTETEKFAELSYYNGMTFAETEGLHSGWLFETESASGEVEFLDRVYGDFTMIGQPLQEQYANTAPGWNKDYQGFSLIFSDLENADNNIEFVFEETADNYATVKATYKEKTEMIIGDYSSGISVCTPYLVNSPYATPICFRFDPNSKVINCGPVPDTADVSFANSFPDFSGFESYSVSFRFNNVVFKCYPVQGEDGNWSFDYAGNNAYRTAKFVVYELCGQLLSGETPANTAGPMIRAEFPDTVVGQPLDLSLYASAYDVLSGKSSSISFEVSDSEGKKVELSDDGKTFVAEKTGNYSVKVVADDGAGKTSEKTVPLAITQDITDPIMNFDKQYNKNYPVGYELEILIPEVTDNVDKDLTASYKLYFGEKEISANNGKVKLNEVGEYKIVYTVSDSAGNSVEEIIKFNVVQLSFVPEEGYKLQSSDKSQSIPLITVPEGWSYKIEMYDASYKNETDLLQGKISYVFDKSGSYIIRYKIILENDIQPSLEVDTTLTVEGSQNTEPEGDPAMPVWQIVLIVVGSVLVVGAAGMTLWLVLKRRKNNDENK